MRTVKKKKGKKRKLRFDRLLILIGAIVSIALLTVFTMSHFFPKEETSYPETDVSYILKRLEQNSPYPVDDAVMTAIHSEYAIVVDDTTGRTLAEKRSSERMYPASLTKMMTAIVTVENMGDLNQTVEITYEMLAGLYEANASVVGYQIGDTPTMEDILYGIALPSGADACNAAAFTIAGSIESFVDMMNAKAEELGMYNTHFSNTTGLHEDDHYTTAEDLAVLLRYCIDNEVFAEVFSTPVYYASAVTSHPYGIEMYSTVFKSETWFDIAIPGLQGGKTGFTYEAGKCLATWDVINGNTVIIITGNAGDDMMGIEHYTDHGFITSILTDTLKKECSP